MSLVSVLMPMRNAEPYVRMALESVLVQPSVDLEVVVIDDGSTDRSPDIVREIGDPRVRMLPGPRKGFVGAMNAALEAARGTLVCECDSDDLYPPDRLGWQARWMDEHPDFGAICGRYSTIDSKGNKVVDFDCGPAAAEITDELRQAVTRTHLCSYLIRTDLMRRLGGLRPYFPIGADIDFQMRLGEICRVWFEPRPCYLWRLHDTSLTHTQSNAKQEFLEETAREFCRQRRSGRPDDLERGCPPTPPADVPGTAVGSGEHVQGMLLGQAWHEHEQGHKLRALRTGLRACLAHPSSLGAWKSLGALLVKRSQHPE